MAQSAVLFPGQGSQYAGMGNDWVSRFSIAKETFAEASEVLGFDILDMCFHVDLTTLTLTFNAQPALLVYSVAAFRVYREQGGLLPAIGAGHSLGEISALTCSGVLTLSDAVRLVHKRGLVMHEANKTAEGRMVAVNGLSPVQVERVLKRACEEGDRVVIACINSPSQVVISGKEESVTKAAKQLNLAGAKVHPLQVGAAFHSPLMQDAVHPFYLALKDCVFHDGEFPVISNLTGLPYEAHSDYVDILLNQLTHPVRWTESMQFMSRYGIKQAFEFGPRQTLKNLMMQITPMIRVLAFDHPEERCQILNGSYQELCRISPESVYEQSVYLLDGCLRILAATKNRNQHGSGLSPQVMHVQEVLWKMRQQIQNSRTPLQMDDAAEVIHLMRIAQNEKCVPLYEQRNQCRELASEIRLGDWINLLTC